MDTPQEPWEILSNDLQNKNTPEISDLLESLSAPETARAISRLSEGDQKLLFSLLSPEDAAEIIEDISETQAAEMMESIPIETAAAILEELDSDHLVDVLGEVDDDISDAILSRMSAKEAKETRLLLNYAPDCAGGLMISEFLAFRTDDTIQDVLDNLQENRSEYKTYNVQYFYVVDKKRTLRGVLRVHDLLFPDRDTMLADIMIPDPLCVAADTPLTELKSFFEDHKLFGAPVVNDAHQLVGVLLPRAVEEEISKQKTKTFLRLSGIVGGEEFRTMPLAVRSGRRLSWLSLNIVLNIVAASVIALYQDTLAAAIALAVFLPMVSDMSGCSGNQAVAVSMRELSLGLVKPGEIIWVVLKEAKVGIINGLVLGLLLGTVAFLWQRNIWLGVVVGAALAANTLVSVTLGGTLPLLLKRMKMDPALVSSPLLTTVTDMCGFFFVLSFAAAVLPKL